MPRQWDKKAAITPHNRAWVTFSDGPLTAMIQRQLTTGAYR
jgi:hypothetical protein